MIEASHPPLREKYQNPLVKGRGVTVEFERLKLFENVDFDLFEGESLVLIGPSGQGKTTLLKMMAGLIDPTSGSLEFEGENWSKLSITQRNCHYRKRGMLFQKNALFDSMTALANVCFPLLETTKEPESEIQDKAVALLKEVGLEHALHLHPDEMSGGMQKRLGIARAMILRPPILLNDDPVAGLDPITSKKIVELILQLRDETKMTVVSVLNDVNRAFELATRLLFVADGEILDLGSPQEARKTQIKKVQLFLKGEAP